MKGIISKLKEEFPKIEYNNKNDFSPTIYLFQKFAYRVPKGWYGVCIENVPFVWAKIIEKFFDELEKVCPDFEILQVKTKFSFLRIYLNLKTESEEIKDIVKFEIRQLEDWLQDKSLMY